MSVRPILLQADGAVFGTPGAYRALPPKMAGRYAGSDALEDVTYYTVNASGEAELKTVKAYPFYVDSIAGGADIGGDGTLANPWRSVNYALTQLQPKLTCLNSTSCCTCLVLRVKGTVDYSVTYAGEVNFQGYDRFIMEPWENDYITISLSNGYPCVWNVSTTIFKKIKMGYASDVSESIISLMDCTDSIFNNFEINMSIPYQRFTGVYECYRSIFYKCVCLQRQEVPKYSDNRVTGFSANTDSIFYETNANVYGNSNMYGFSGNMRSAFYSCNGYVYAIDSYIKGCGFYGNNDSVFINCNGNSLGSITCDI